MGMFDKAKFWKKDHEELSDFGDLDLGDFGDSTQPTSEGFPNREEVEPTQASKDLGAQFGLNEPIPERPMQQQFQQPSQQPPHQQSQQQFAQQSSQQQFGQSAPTQQAMPQQQMSPPEQYSQNQYNPQYAPRSDVSDIAKEVEIIHAKLDAIKSTLDSINQRLATIERAAYGDTNKKYTW